MSDTRQQWEQESDGHNPSHIAQPEPSSLAAMPGSVSELQGFNAAEIAIERMLDEAKEKCPKRLLNINRQSAAYRAGAYEAFMAAHCTMVYGSFPNHPMNQPRILELLKTQSVELSDSRPL